MTTLLFTHKACIEHDPGAHHPEQTGAVSGAV